MRINPLLPLAVLPLFACGGPDPVAPIDDVDPVPVCGFEEARGIPEVGASPVHRATPVEVHWSGAVDHLALTVTADGAPVEGEVLVGARSAVFVPHELYPVNSSVRWVARACGKSLEGWFGVGELAHPLVDVAGVVGRHPFEVDLRLARLEIPHPRDPLAEVLLRFHLSPALLVTFARIDKTEATVLIAPGIADEDGTVRQDMSRPIALAKVALDTNPYVFLPRTDLELALGRGAVTLRSADLVLGLGATRMEDGRLVADLDLRDAAWEDGEDACELVGRLSDDACRPCADGVNACVPLVMEDITGLPASNDVELPPLESGPLP